MTVLKFRRTSALTGKKNLHPSNTGKNEKNFLWNVKFQASEDVLKGVKLKISRFLFE